MESKNERTLRIRHCPECGKDYIGAPATSRIDDATPICPDCGARQALSAMGIPEEEIEEIIQTQHEVLERLSS